MITVLAGGTGSVKLVRGLVALEKKVNVISKSVTSSQYQNYRMLYIPPQIDAVLTGIRRYFTSILIQIVRLTLRVFYNKSF